MKQKQTLKQKQTSTETQKNISNSYYCFGHYNLSPFFCIFLTLIFIIFLSSCGNTLIKRNARGEQVDSSYKETFTPIKKKIALLPLFNEGLNGGDDLGITATEEFRQELSRTREFIVEEKDATIFGSSKEIYSGGGIKLALLSQKAKLSGINFVLFGRILNAKVRDKVDEIGFLRELKSFGDAKIEIKLYDTTSNKEIFSDILDSFITDNSYNFYFSDPKEQLEYRQELLRYLVKVAIRKSIPKIVDASSKLDWTGRVAKIVGNRIYVNAGRKSGVQLGDILKIITEGNEIFDPETGAFLGVSKGEAKGTIEVLDYFGADGSVAILHSGGNISEGDLVQLY
ncbi:MAG: hypothetical protein HQK51_07175 [Oligoflexia bacterium]|nr:hypothetical protein [Oligoflexia bacterium]